MAPVTIERVSASEAKQRREEMLREVGMNAEELCARSDRFELDARQWVLAREYERLTFLLEASGE